jgi:hypothetical protein
VSYLAALRGGDHLGVVAHKFTQGVSVLLGSHPQQGAEEACSHRQLLARVLAFLASRLFVQLLLPPPGANVIVLKLHSKFDKREERNTCEALAYRVVPISVAHSACESESGRIENLSLTNFHPLKAVPLIDIRLHLE